MSKIITDAKKVSQHGKTHTHTMYSKGLTALPDPTQAQNQPPLGISTPSWSTCNKNMTCRCVRHAVVVLSHGTEGLEVKQGDASIRLVENKTDF